MSFRLATPGGLGSSEDWYSTPEVFGGHAGAVLVADKPMAIDPSWIQAGSNVLSAALSPGAAGPSRAESGGYYTFDNSGFAVNFGSGGISQTQPVSMWVMAGIGLLVLVWLKQKRK